MFNEKTDVMDYTKYIKAGYHIFKGVSGFYIKMNTTPGGRAATGRLGTTVFFVATNAAKIFKNFR